MKQKKTYYFYKITSPSNRVYIGQTINFSRRMEAYKKFRCKSQRRLLTSLLSHGADAHKFELLYSFECDEELAYLIEVELIEIHNAFFKNGGLNLTIGGAGFSGRTGKDNPRYGTKMLDHVRAAIKKANTGIVRDAEFRRKLSENNGMKNPEHYQKMVDRVRSEESRRKIRENTNFSKGGEHYRSVAVLQCDLDGNIVKRWDTITEAAVYFQTWERNIRRCLTGERSTHKGFVWKRTDP